MNEYQRYLTRIERQIIKRRLANATEDEKKSAWARAETLSRNNSHVSTELMTMTKDSDFLLEISYFRSFWDRIEIDYSLVDRHFETVRAAAAWDYIEQCYEPQAVKHS